MKKLLSIPMYLIFLQSLSSQNFCDMNGNIMIFSNYDGGTLNIDVDENIQNLKIGVIAYEQATINLSGNYVGNVTDVVYVGYNGSNNHCGSATTTTINGAPSSAGQNIVVLPNVTLTNTNGYFQIVCAYSCSINTSQGGCNTIDQVEHYLLNYFSNSSVYAHKVQYGCWSGTQKLSDGGTCCANISSLQVTARTIDDSCQTNCKGKVIAGAAGGNPPYVYTISGNPVPSNLCPGTYTVQVQDASSDTATTTVVVGSLSPDVPVGDSIQEYCRSAKISNLNVTGQNVVWFDSAVGGTMIDTNSTLSNNQTYYAAAIQGNCESSRLPVLVKTYPQDISTSLNVRTIAANAKGLTYQWLVCDSAYTLIPGETNDVFHAVNDGSYAVIITENSCSDTSECVDVIGTGLDRNENQSIFNCFPNPTDKTLNFVFKDDVTNIRIAQKSLAGQVIKTDHFNSIKSVEFDLLGDPGFYLIEVEVDQKFEVIKVLKN